MIDPNRFVTGMGIHFCILFANRYQIFIKFENMLAGGSVRHVGHFLLRTVDIGWGEGGGLKLKRIDGHHIRKEWAPTLV